jgi:DNA polymerase III alpha subunit (gram-positive type)
LKEKQKEKEQLEKLEREIQINQQIIDEKKANNEAINQEYQHSAKKELEIKEAFERIKQETGINECEELLPLFVNLHEKNTTMNIFVNELTKDLEEIDKEIAKVKEEIKCYNTKGATKDVRKHELKVSLSEKIVQEEKKKEILRVQYEKSLETMQIIKGYLENILESIGVPQEKIQG